MFGNVCSNVCVNDEFLFIVIFAEYIDSELWDAESFSIIDILTSIVDDNGDSLYIIEQSNLPRRSGTFVEYQTDSVFRIKYLFPSNCKFILDRSQTISLLSFHWREGVRGTRLMRSDLKLSPDVVKIMSSSSHMVKKSLSSFFSKYSLSFLISMAPNRIKWKQSSNWALRLSERRPSLSSRSQAFLAHAVNKNLFAIWIQ